MIMLLLLVTISMTVSAMPLNPSRCVYPDKHIYEATRDRSGLYTSVHRNDIVHHILELRGGGDVITNSGKTEHVDAATSTRVLEARPKSTKMASVFDPAVESDLDRYAAALAATEPLRTSRDQAIQNTLGKNSVRQNTDRETTNILKSASGAIDWLCRVTSSFGIPSSKNSDIIKTGAIARESINLCTPDNCDKHPEIRAACATYALQSSRIVRGLGLSVAQFNNISRRVAENNELKEKVMQQAYLYRIAAALKLEKIPVIEDPTSVKLLNSHRQQRFELFAQSLVEIEELRSEQTEALKRSLHIKDVPKGVSMCDPNLLPLLSPKVKAVCEAFPLQAEEIVKKYGLNSDEFNKMLAETKSNPLFRWRVGRFIDNFKSSSIKASTGHTKHTEKTPTK
mmetsp:Transcript_25706/g.51150  ORF Transcript_25706/g.51150 Transcript_25706/m.51150 type:complete len:397 (+) Transcript_25706:241-1431(+)